MSGSSSRQNQMVADEMFPDGPGNLDFVDVEDGVRCIILPLVFLKYCLSRYGMELVDQQGCSAISLRAKKLSMLTFTTTLGIFLMTIILIKIKGPLYHIM